MQDTSYDSEQCAPYDGTTTVIFDSTLVPSSMSDEKNEEETHLEGHAGEHSVECTHSIGRDEQLRNKSGAPTSL